MDAPRSDRWMALAGPAFLVLFVVALALSGDSAPEKANGAAVISKLADQHDKQAASVFLAVPLVALLLAFTASMRTAFGAAGGAGKRLFQYGAVLYGAGILLGAMLTLALVSAVDHKLPAAAEALNVLNAADWIPFIGGAAVLLLGGGIAVLRTAVLPAWLGWVALVSGVISLFGPGGFLAFAVTPIWIAIAGTMVYLRAPAADGAAVV